MASASSTPADAKVPLLASASGTGGGAPFALWRPQMQTFLMRHGIETRDYAREIAQWSALAAAVEQDAESEERAAIEMVLAASSAAASSHKSSSSDESLQTVKREALSPEQIKAKQRVSDLISRSRKAFGYLHASLSSDLRPLIADVPQGYAFGIWSFLEKKFRNTEQDSVMALWERATTLSMDPDDTFDVYKAKVDSVNELLVNAKQTLPPGLYASILLWRLQPRYSTAVLTLKTGERLKDPAAIDWPAIAEYMAQFERSQLGLGVSDGATDRALALRSKSANDGNKGQQPPVNQSHVECYNCHQLGHYANDCPKPDRRVKNADGQWKQQKQGRKRGSMKKKKTPERPAAAASSSGDDSDDSESSAPVEGKMKQRANMARALIYANNPFAALAASESTEEDDTATDEATVRNPDHSYVGRAMMGLAAASQASNKKSNQEPPAPTLRRLKRPGELDAKSNVAAAAASEVGDKKKPVSFGPPTSAKAKETSRRASRQKSLDEALRTTAKAVDSAATLSITGNKDNLINVRRCMPMPILMADNTIVSAMYKGEMPMRLPIAGRLDQTVSVTIKDVYYHERIDANLLSWGCMREGGWEMHSTKDGTYLITPKGRHVTASTRGRFTLLNDAGPERVYAARLGRFVCTNAEDLIQLHQRVGHASWGRLLKMCRAGATAGIGSIEAMPAKELQKAEKAIKECVACTEGKQHRNALGHSGLDHGKKPGDVLHMDTFYTTLRDPRTNQKCRQYCLLVTDPFTEMRWAAVESTLHDLQTAAIEIMHASSTLNGWYPRLVVTDLGSEFDNKKVAAYCRSHGIHLQPSPARAKEMNGIAEKGVDTVKNHVRTMLLASKVPDQIGWERAVQHHVYVWNRTHIGRHTGKTPREAATGNEASVLNLGVFGCDAFVHQDRTQRDTTFSAKALPGIYLGHDAQQNCPVVRMLHTGKTIRAKDVIFREDSFRHMQAELKGRADEMESLDLRDAADTDQETSSERKSGSSTADKNSECESDDDREEAKYPEAPRNTDNSSRQYRVKAITEKRTTESGQSEYRVQWVGYSAETWEPADTIEEDAPDAVEDFTTFVNRRSEVRITRSAARAQVRLPAAAPAAVVDSDDEASGDEHISSEAVRFAAAKRL